MRMTATAVLLLACAVWAFAAEGSHKAYLFAPTNFGIRIPSGFSRVSRPGPPPDFKSWVFTNAAGSRLSFTIDGHGKAAGKKAGFKGFAALEFKTNLVRHIAFDSSGFSHSELENIGRPPEYDVRLEYRAATSEDQGRLDESIESFFVSQKKEANTSLEHVSEDQEDL